MFFAGNYILAMIHGYAYRHDPQSLEDAGAERIWYDAAPEREKRRDMMGVGALREGDTLLVYSIHQLAGSPRAYDRWITDLKARGVRLRVVEDGAPKPPHRPRKYDPDLRRAQRHWAIWTDGHRTERDRLAAIQDENDDVPVTRQTLNGRYGNPTNPGPRPEL